MSYFTIALAPMIADALDTSYSIVTDRTDVQYDPPLRIKGLDATWTTSDP